MSGYGTDGISTGLELAWLMRGSLFVGEHGGLFTDTEAKAAGDLVKKFYGPLSGYEKDKFEGQIEFWTREEKLTASHKNQILRNAGIGTYAYPRDLRYDDGIDTGLELGWLLRGALFVSEQGGAFTDTEAQRAGQLVNKFAAVMSAREVYNFRGQVEEWVNKDAMTARSVDRVFEHVKY